MPVVFFFPHDSGGIFEYADDLHNLKFYVWISHKHLDSPTFIKLNSHLTYMLIILWYVNKYGKIAICKNFGTQLYILLTSVYTLFAHIFHIPVFHYWEQTWGNKNSNCN